MNAPCNNTSKCHNPVIIGEDLNAARVICLECKHIYILRKDARGVFENRAYSQVFKKDILQGKDNLFYKYHPEHMNT